MKKIDFKQTFINGLFLAIPLLAIFYIGLKIINLIEKLITPLANKFGVHRLLGELTLTIFALIILLILIYLFGILLRLKIMNNLHKQVEGIAYKIMPQLYKIRSLATDSDGDGFSQGWRPVILEEENSWTPAYITASTEEWITVFLPEAPDGRNGQIKMLKASATRYKTVDGLKFHGMIHHYGIGMIELKNETEKDSGKKNYGYEN